MYETILTRQDINKSTEIHNLGNLAFVNSTNFDFCNYHFDTSPGFITRCFFHRSNFNHTIIIDFNRCTGFFGNRTDRRATFTNHVPDFLGVNLESNQARRVFRHFFTAFGDYLGHLTENGHAAFFCLIECFTHDFSGNAINLDIHLQCGNTFGSTGNFEVHITEMIFITQNIG